MLRSACALALSGLLAMSVCALAQSGPHSLEGMWSDPPATPQDFVCFGFCTQWGIDYLEALLDDPKNDDRTFDELWAEVQAHESTEYFRPRLSEAALETFPLDHLKDDEGYLHCEPWGLASQMFAPHQLEIRLFADRIEMRYGEWAARRTVYIDGRALPEHPPVTRLGYSVGHFEGDSLVIETRGVSANHTPWWSRHSDRLRISERYSRDGCLRRRWRIPGGLGSRSS